MIYVLTGNAPEYIQKDAELLARAIGGQRVRRFDGMHFWVKGKRLPELTVGDRIISWGGAFPDVEGLFVCNRGDVLHPYQATARLALNHVPTVPIVNRHNARHPELNTTIWTRRLHSAIEGSDLLGEPVPHTVADYATNRIRLDHEYRVHVVHGRVVLAGEKVKARATAHEWVRTAAGGWMMQYEGFRPPTGLKTFARKAMKILQMDFGSVDVGVEPQKGLTFINLNPRPKLQDAKVLQAYTEGLKAWAETVGVAGAVVAAPDPQTDEAEVLYPPFDGAALHVGGLDEATRVPDTNTLQQAFNEYAQRTRASIEEARSRQVELAAREAQYSQDAEWVRRQFAGVPIEVPSTPGYLSQADIDNAHAELQIRRQQAERERNAGLSLDRLQAAADRLRYSGTSIPESEPDQEYYIPDYDEDDE